MPHTNQVTPTTCCYIVEKVNKRRTSRDIGQEIGYGHTTISQIYNKYSLSRDWYHSAPKLGRPLKFSVSDEKYTELCLDRGLYFNVSDLQRSLFPQVSSWMVRWHLFDHGLKGYIMRRKPLLKRSSKFKRMA